MLFGCLLTSIFFFCPWWEVSSHASCYSPICSMSFYLRCSLYPWFFSTLFIMYLSVLLVFVLLEFLWGFGVSGLLIAGKRSKVLTIFLQIFFSVNPSFFFCNSNYTYDRSLNAILQVIRALNCFFSHFSSLGLPG